MRFQIDNIGKVKHADIIIDGITVIGGDNDTGKSTVGRALSSFFTSCFDVDEKIKDDRIGAITGVFANAAYLSSVTLVPKSKQILNHIINEKDKYINNRELLIEPVNKILEFNKLSAEDLFGIYDSKKYVDNIVLQMTDILKLSGTDIMCRFINRIFADEFSGQINNLYVDEPAKMNLNIKGQNMKLLFENNRIKDVSDSGIFSLQIAPVYIDDPLAIDFLSPKSRYSENWRRKDNKTSSLINKLLKERSDTAVSNELIIDEKFNEIFSQVSNISELKIVGNNDEQGKSYQDANSGKVLEIANLSTGLKSFLILKRLIENGSIENRGLVIIDEPEVHLHPEWQLLYAELIVLMQKTFNLHILINTHSPYFLRAIEVYSAKHKISDRCNYYLSGLDDNFAVFEDCTSCIEKIYAKLASPLNMLDQIKMELENNE